VLYLDSVLALTRGNPLNPFNFLSYLNPNYGIYTGVSTPDDRQSVVGQIRYPLGAHSAHLMFLAPGETCNMIALPGLLEHLAYQAGTWGALNLIGEVDEHTSAFEAFRRSGFSIYAWQRIWQFNNIPLPEMTSNPKNDCRARWCNPSTTDIIAVRSLYQSVVPALVLPVEPVTETGLHGLVYRQGDEITAYADIIYGPKGIWVQPFILPETDNVLDVLSKLLRYLSRPAGRPVYLCVRSYQAWLESDLENISGQVGSRQAVMVKHMAIAQKSLAAIRKEALENGRAEPSVQVAHIKLDTQ